MNPREIISIEGIPLITRFKTMAAALFDEMVDLRIEGIPLITRFKTYHQSLQSHLRKD